MRIVKLDEASMKNILADMLKRDPNNYDAYTETVQEIVDKVKVEGDRAVFDYTRKFDKAQINAENIRVTEAEIKEAMEEVDLHLLEVMKKSMENIRRYHEKQRRNSVFWKRQQEEFTYGYESGIGSRAERQTVAGRSCSETD